MQDWLALVGASSLRTLDKFRGDDAVWSRIDPGSWRCVEWARASVGPAPGVIEALDACHTLNLALVDLFHGVSLLLSPTVAGQLPVSASRAPSTASPTSTGWRTPTRST